MKGIREAAMSKEPKESSLFDSELYRDEQYPSYSQRNYSRGNYKITNKGEITISMIIDSGEIGEIADYTNPAYDWAAAETKATEIAYDRTEALLGKGYALRYSASFQISPEYDEFEVTVTLIPTQSKLN